MAELHYEIVFRGKLLAGHTREQVVARLVALFAVDAMRIELLLAAPKTVLRRGLDRETATRYREALLAAGVMVAMVGVEVTPEAGLRADPWRIAALESSPEAQDAPPGAPPAALALSLADAGTPLGERRSFEAPKVNLRGMRIAAANVPIDTRPRPEPVSVSAPDLPVEEIRVEDKERSDFTRLLMRELRT